MVKLHIKLKGTANTATWSPNLWDRVNRSKVKFSEICQVAYQIKGKHEIQQHGSNYFARRPTNLGWGQWVKIQLSECGHVTYRITGKRNAATW